MDSVLRFWLLSILITGCIASNINQIENDKNSVDKLKPSNINDEVDEDNDLDEDFEDNNDNDSISDHVLHILFNLNLILQKAQEKFASNQESSEIQSTVLNDIINPIVSVTKIVVKLQMDLSDNCHNSLLKLLDDLKMEKLWAYQMIDSNGLLPNSGLTSGTMVNFGAYDNCLAIKTADPDPDSIQGQYCLVETKLVSSEKELMFVS